MNEFPQLFECKCIYRCWITASEVELIHAGSWALGRMIGRISTLLHVLDLELCRFLADWPTTMSIVVVHDKNHGQVARVGHRVVCLVEAHLVILFLLAGASAHAWLKSTHGRLVDSNLVQVACLDVCRLCLMMVGHMGESWRTTSLRHHLRRHDLSMAIVVVRNVTVWDANSTRWVRHDALRLGDGLQRHPGRLCLALHHLLVVLRLRKVVVREARHIVSLVEWHSGVVLTDIGCVEGAVVLS